MAMMPSFPSVSDLSQAGLPTVQGPNFGDAQFPTGAPIQVQQQLTPAIPGDQLQQQQYQQPQFAQQPQQFAAPQPQFAAPQQFAPQQQAAFVPPPQQFEQPQQFAAPAAPAEFSGNLVPPPMPAIVAPALPGAPAQAEAATSDVKKPNAKTLIAAIKKGEHDHELNTLVDDRASVQEAIANRKAALTGGAPAATPSFDNQSYAAPANPADTVVYVPVPVSKLHQVLGVL